MSSSSNIFQILLCLVLFFNARTYAGDLEKLQGTWRQTSGKAGKNGLADKDYVMTITGSNYKTKEVVKRNWKLILDASVVPMKMDLISLDESSQGKKTLGFLQLDGSRLIEYLAAVEKERPKNFEADSNDHFSVRTWRRVGSAPDAALPIDRQIEGDWELISYVIRGREVPTHFARGFRIKIAGGEYHLINTSERHGEMRLEKNTQNFDSVESESGNICQGIYELESENSLRVCMGFSNLRPLEFSTRSHHSFILREFKKVEHD